MKPSTRGLVGASVALILLSGCASADLVVRSFQATGPPTVNASNSVELPVEVVVANVGNADAATSKVCTRYTGSQGNFVVAFTVPGQANFWYPFTADPLAAGTTETFSGILTFHPAVHGQTVSITARADCCDGDEFVPAYCRVNESDEGNNVSAAISQALP